MFSFNRIPISNKVLKKELIFVYSKIINYFLLGVILRRS